MVAQTPRILIDCSHIDFSKQPTGIPRVVLSYIEVGYKWGRERGIDVIPVLPTSKGLVICRPLPGRGAPPALVERVAGSTKEHVVPTSTQVLSDAAHYLADVVLAVAKVPATVVPSKTSRAVVQWLEETLRTGASSILDKHVHAAEDLITLVPRTGDVLFSPAYWHDVDPAIYLAIKQAGARIVILVHDILPIVFEKFYPTPWRYLFRERVAQTTSYADALFCVSDYTRDTLREFLTRQKRTLPALSTALNGFEPLVSEDGLSLIRASSAMPHLADTRIASIMRERKPYIMVGSVEPKKGHLPTIKCFEAMWRAGLDRDLVVIGRKGWMERQITEAIEQSLFYGEKLHWFSGLDDFDLADAYVHSHALIMSSLAEGFGIPMVEASFYGKPVVVYDNPISREVLGTTGLYFTDAITLVEHIMNLEEPEHYAGLCEKAAEFRWPLWDEYTPSVFDRLLQLVTNPSRLTEIQT